MFVKKRDAWCTVLFFDLFSITLVKFINSKVNRLQPDHLTFFSLIFFFVAIFLLFQNYINLYLICMVISVVCDCADGKLARLKNIKTKHGKMADAFVDLFIHGIGYLFIGFWFFINNQFVTSVLVVLWCCYFGVMHINSIFKNEHTLITEVVSQDLSRWDAWCKKNRLIKNPFTDVEVAFLVIPFSVLNLDYSHIILMISSLIFCANRYFFK